MKFRVKNLAAIAFCCSLASVSSAQSAAADPQKPADQAAPAAAPAAPAAPAALPTPSITGPLSGLPPAVFDAGPFGKVAVNGLLSGMGLVKRRTAGFSSTCRRALTICPLWELHSWPPIKPLRISMVRSRSVFSSYRPERIPPS